MPEWLGLAVLCLAPARLPDALQSALEYRPDAVLDGELWRLLTGHWVHHGWHHAAMDAAALALLAHMIAPDARRHALLCLLPGSAAISLVLLIAVPQMAVYRGASGLVYLLGGVLVATLWRSRPGWRVGLVAACAILTARLVADASGVLSNWTSLPPGVQVAWQAHLAGFVMGVIVGHRMRKRNG